MIPESTVSILIPTYNNAILAERALKSAIRTGAGEIIVCDDNSNDKTLKLLNAYKDSRIRFISNEINVGLWENHLRALKLAKYNWIKFLQQDDVIEEGGLKALCEQADEKTAIIGTLALILDLETNEKQIPQTISKPRRWSSEAYLERLTQVGYELGNPSLTLIRKDAFELDEKLWSTDISTDYIMHVIIPTKGDVVIIPPGAITVCSHKQQESQTVNFSKAVRRMANTLIFLSNYPNEKVRQHAHLVAVHESFGFLVYARGQLKREKRLYKGFWSDWFKIVRVIDLMEVLFNINKIYSLFSTKYFGYNKNLDLN